MKMSSNTMSRWGETYFLKRPSNKVIVAFLDQQKEAPFSYPEAGATRGTLPQGYIIDHYRIKLGQGEKTFRAAQSAISNWSMFQIPWLQLCWQSYPPQEGITIAILIRCLNLWTLNAARVIYLIHERGAVEKCGFAYGTLPAHMERGEERFMVEWQRSDDSVWYDILAFSHPNRLMAYFAYPYVRFLQKRFGHDSLQAVCRAVNK